MLQRPKYNANKTIIDWRKFDSKIESDYYLYLKSQWIDFECQKRYVLQDKFTCRWEKLQPIYYVSDFSYGNVVVDVKWMPTWEARLKRKLFMYKYPELELKWLVKYKWERVSYFDNEKRKRENKKS
jgi:hypothetical protein